MEVPKLFRCRICGEVYFGNHPSHCPYCGVHAKYLVVISVWSDENTGISVSDVSRKNLETAKDLEFHASRLYRTAAKEAKSGEVQGLFKYLAKIEREHYMVACKLLKTNALDEINGFGDDSKKNDILNLKESAKLEVAATKLYTKFAAEANETRIKDFFLALSEVESDHIDLDNSEINKLNERGLR